MKFCILGCGIGGVSTLYYMWKFRSKLPIDEIVVYGVNCNRCRCGCGVQKWKLDLVNFDIYKKFIISKIEKAIINFKNDEINKTFEVKSRGVFSGYVIDREKLQQYIINEFVNNGFIKFFEKVVTIHDVGELVKNYDFIVNATSFSLIDVGKFEKTEYYYICTQGVTERGIDFEENTIYMFFRSYIPIGYAWVFPWRENTVHIGLGILNKFRKRQNVEKLLKKFVKECVDKKLIKNENVKNIVTKPIPCFNASTLFNITHVEYEDFGKFNRLPSIFLISVHYLDKTCRIVNVGDAVGMVDSITGAGIANTIIQTWAFVKTLTEVLHSFDKFIDALILEITRRKIEWLLNDLSHRYEVIEKLLTLKSNEIFQIILKVYEHGSKWINIFSSFPLPKKLLTYVIPFLSKKLTKLVNKWKEELT